MVIDSSHFDVPAHGGSGLSRRSFWLWAVLVLALLGLAWGWHLFRFLCDDAYIGFRYVGNAMAGFGLTWNPPPFRAVEGYTSFLWELLLLATWKLTGLDPTQSAAQLGLLCAAGSVVHVWRMARDIPVGQKLESWRPLLVALVLLGTLSNRTFLAFTSSGLEAPLLTMLLLGWVDAVARRRIGSLTLHAGLLPLCRPDGMMVVAATGLVLLLEHRRVRWFHLLPLLLPPLHLLWRHATYGFWLPNTYYAKVTGSFFESGWRYFACWMLEYAWWFSVAVLLVALVVRARRKERLQIQTWPIAAGALLASAGWYTAWLGGDHFEYRIYAHFVPLGWLALLGALGVLRASPRAAVSVLVVQLALSLPIPWTHWVLTKDLTTRKETRGLAVPVAPHLPSVVRPYTAAFDTMQAWLISHSVGMRHQEHVAFARNQLALVPLERPPTAEVVAAWTNPAEIMSASVPSVGVIGWALPQIAIIDTLGLNDAVVARNKDLRPGRNMTHEHQPPPGYVECFRPNAAIHERKLFCHPREVPLRPADVIECEDKWWGELGLPRPGSARASAPK